MYEEEYYYDEDDDNYCGGGCYLDEESMYHWTRNKAHSCSFKSESPAISELFLKQGDIQLNEDGLFHIAEALQTNFSLVFHHAK